MNIFKGCNEGRHTFEARYDEDLSEKFPWERVTKTYGDTDALRQKTYVRDICTRCGMTIERDGTVVSLKDRAA